MPSIRALSLAEHFYEYTNLFYIGVFGEKIYKDLEADVEDFNLHAFDMNVEPISVPEYITWLIRRDVAEWRKRKNDK